ncbi:hypothetical protein KKE48_04360 [Patescibacteria group bacterium]|nr:hypothetical protein [Patescibacteria group bacterium]
MDKVSEMPPAFESVKDRLFREFPKKRIEGINTERVEDFIRQEGLEIKPYIIFDREDLPRVRDIVGSTGLLRSIFKNGECGLYSPEMDMVLVTRDRDYEKSSGSIYTEGLLVHELAHASSVYQGYVTADYKGFYTPRVGFCLPQNQVAWGWLLEEGWADIHRADYFAQNASEEEKQKLEEALRFGTIGMEDTVPITTPAGETLPLPAKYLYITPDGKPTTKSSSYAGYALELLCKSNPAMQNLLIEGRSSVDGLRKLVQAFEKIMPGLYKKLQTGEYSEASFSEKLSTVVTNVAGGMDSAVRAQGALRSTWNNLLHK